MPVGEGFYFNNSATTSFNQLFVGEVLQGRLVNHLPAGYSMKGSMVPQSGSINSAVPIPGQPGDEFRLYVNEGADTGRFVMSVFSGDANAWVPDVSLGVAQGFWIFKQNAEDWVRDFGVN